MGTKRQEIATDIRKNYGNMLNIKQATKALGFKDPRAAQRFLDGVPYCDTGRQKKYLASDIAYGNGTGFDPANYSGAA
ncbi:hypothetical protein [uncultured Oscillibacter sp.]|uniref:hypothetical protein n=1 Tax=uncultured Oscillibacter sp. TaxID=876091 RepID=UPI0025F65C01|nr:hypothetical protein [uncultured Oscillibacter sp.]